LAHGLVGFWNSDDNGEDHHVHGKFQRAQPWASSATVIATPSGIHSFVNWTQNAKVVSTSASYTFTMPSASTTLTAHFK
jgi:hypothetical protein